MPVGSSGMEIVQCQKCEQIEARQIAVRDKRTQLLVDGKLTTRLDEALQLEEYSIVGELKDHQALEHDHDKQYEGQHPHDLR